MAAVSKFLETLNDELKGLCNIAGLSGTNGFLKTTSSPGDSTNVLGAGVGLGGLFLSNVLYSNSTEPRKLGSGFGVGDGFVVTTSGLGLVVTSVGCASVFVSDLKTDKNDVKSFYKQIYTIKYVN